MATTADFRTGLCLVFNHDLFTIVDFQHVKPGKGAAFVRTKLKSLTTGKVIDNTFNAGVSVTTARIEHKKFQFLYKDEMGYNFMDSDTFEQLTLEEDLVEGYKFLKEGQEVEALYHAESDKILSVQLPPFVIMQITYTEPGIRGNTATNTLKPATVETGAKVMVPLFVDQDEVIKIDTRTGEYVERVK